MCLYYVVSHGSLNLAGLAGIRIVGAINVGTAEKQAFEELDFVRGASFSLDRHFSDTTHRRLRKAAGADLPFT